MNAVSRSFIRYAALRSCLRGIAVFTVLAPPAVRNVWAQPVPGADENVLAEEEADSPEPPPAAEEPEVPRELPRKAKKPPPTPQGPLRSRAREAANRRDVQREEPASVRVHLESPVPAALYDVGTDALPEGAEPPNSHLVCHSPCDREVAVSEGQVFSVWAANLERSKDFSIPASGPRAVVELQPESPLLNDVGLVIGTTGAGMFCLGGAALLGLKSGQDNEGLLVAAGLFAGTGLMLGLIGLPMMMAPREADVVVRTATAGEAFAIDTRPEARPARPWLGEF
jgi:hypothetical protein